MERLMKFIPSSIFVAYLVKMLMITPGYAEMGILIALAAVVGVEIALSKQGSIEEIREACAKQVEDIKVVVNKQNDLLVQMSLEIQTVKRDMSGITLKNAFNSSNIAGIPKKVG